MPASIFGDRFVGFRQPAWHGLGEVFEDRINVSEAVARANIGFEIHKAQNFARMDTGRKHPITGASVVHSVPTDSYSIMREPTYDDPEWQVLATVGKEWTPIQVNDLATMLDPIAEKYPVETAGAIGKGEKVFFTLDAGGAEIAGEDHNLYYLITDHRDGSGALSMAFTPVRVVCQNTLTLGLNEAKVSVNLQHRKNIVDDAKWFTNIFGQMLNAKESSIERMNVLTRTKITDDEALNVINKSYPKPAIPNRLKLSNGFTPDDMSGKLWVKVLEEREKWEKEHGSAIERIQKHKDMAYERYDIFNQEHPRVSETPWAIWQAVVETEDYRRGKEANRGRLTASLYGTRATTKQKAFAQAYKLATV